MSDEGDTVDDQGAPEEFEDDGADSLPKLDTAWNLPLNVLGSVAKWKLRSDSIITDRLRKRQLSRPEGSHLRPEPRNEVAAPDGRGETESRADAVLQETRVKPVHEIEGTQRSTTTEDLRKNRFLKRKSNNDFKLRRAPSTDYWTSRGVELEEQTQETELPPPDIATSRAFRCKGQARQEESMKVLCDQWLQLVLKEEDLATEESIQIANKSQMWLVEKVVPTVTLCLAKVLERAERQEALHAEKPLDIFNPVNFLAETLMRHNPKYSHGEVSSYSKAMKATCLYIKEMTAELTSNYLAKARLEARWKHHEEEKRAAWTREARRLLTDSVKSWVYTDNVLCITRNNILACMDDEANRKSLLEHAERTGTPVDGEMLKIRQSVWGGEEASEALIESAEAAAEIMLPVFQDYSLGVVSMFADILRVSGYRNMSQKLYQGAVDKMLASFSAIDASDAGLLNRHQVIGVLERFYQTASDTLRVSLIHPSDFPVSDILETTMLDTDCAAVEEPAEAAQETATETAAEVVAETSAEETTQPAPTSPEGKVEASTGQSSLSAPMSPEQEQPSAQAPSRTSALRSMLLAGRPPSQWSTSLPEHLPRTCPHQTHQTLLEARNRSRAAVSARYGVMPSLREKWSTPYRMTPIPLSHLSEVCITAEQFVVMIENFLGKELSTSTLDGLMAKLQENYPGTEEEREELKAMAKRESRYEERAVVIDEMFDKLDNEQSDELEIQMIPNALKTWKSEHGQTTVGERMSEVTMHSANKSHLNRDQFNRSVMSATVECEEDEFAQMIKAVDEELELDRKELTLRQQQRRWLLDVFKVAGACRWDTTPAFATAVKVLKKHSAKAEQEKQVSAAVSLLHTVPDTGKKVLRFIAATEEDEFLIGMDIPHGSESASYAAVETGEWQTVTDVREQPHRVRALKKDRPLEETGAFAAIPITHPQSDGVVGVVSMDSMEDVLSRSFTRPELKFAERVAKALSQVMYMVECRRKSAVIMQEAMRWANHCIHSVKTSSLYMMEPLSADKKGQVVPRKYAFRKLIHFFGLTAQITQDSPRIAKGKRATQQYLFRCVETSMPVFQRDCGKRTHIACPVRDQAGRAIAVLDVELESDFDDLSKEEHQKLTHLLRLLTACHIQLADNASGAESHPNTPTPDPKFLQEDADASMVFNQALLDDVNQSLKSLSNNYIQEVKRYNSPSHGVAKVISNTLIFLAMSRGDMDSLQTMPTMDWQTCKQALQPIDLKKELSSVDPLEIKVTWSQMDELEDHLLCVTIPPTELAKPVMWLHQWCTACFLMMSTKLRVDNIQRAEQTKQDDALDRQTVRGEAS